MQFEALKYISFASKHCKPSFFKGNGCTHVNYLITKGAPPLVMIMLLIRNYNLNQIRRTGCAEIHALVAIDLEVVKRFCEGTQILFSATSPMDYTPGSPNYMYNVYFDP